MATARKYTLPWDLMVLTNDMSNLVRRILGVPSKFNGLLSSYKVLIVKHTCGQFLEDFF
jgi:hypothetical protein